MPPMGVLILMILCMHIRDANQHVSESFKRLDILNKFRYKLTLQMLQSGELSGAF